VYVTVTFFYYNDSDYHKNILSVMSLMLIIDVDTSSIWVYRFDAGQGKISMKKTYFCSLTEVVSEYIYESDHHLLLPESAYLFHTLHIEYACHEPFTINNYKQLLQEKKEVLIAQYACDPLYISMVPYIEDELGDAAVRHILGRSGKFSWKWYVYALSAEMVHTLRQLYGRLLSTVVFFPRSLAILRVFTSLLHRTSFTLLNISDQNASLYQIRDGWYEQFAHVPLGIHVLLEAAEDQGVQKYLFRDHEDLQRNTVAQKLLLESLWFYVSTLADRVGSYLVQWSQLVLCCPLVSHPLFIEVMQSTLQMKGAFVVPFATMPHSNGHKIWNNIDFSVAAYLYL
jgi:hypothetical protein